MLFDGGPYPKNSFLSPQQYARDSSFARWNAQKLGFFMQSRLSTKKQFMFMNTTLDATMKIYNDDNDGYGARNVYDDGSELVFTEPLCVTCMGL